MRTLGDCRWLRGGLLLFFALTALVALPLVADPVPVRSSQGTFHGFLVVKTLEGKTLASGDLVQIVHGDRVTNRLTFRFRDGSLDDETAVYSQGKVFRLISDHHVQRGPSYPKPLDMRIDVSSGQIAYRDKEGKIAEQHLDLPPDTCNGLFLTILLNLPPGGPPVRLPLVAPTERPRLMHLEISSLGDDTLSIGGRRRKATKYRLHLEPGGIEGIVAPVIGKEPADIHIWVLGGEVPAFVRGEGQLYEGGPIWRIELASPVFPESR